MAATLAARPVDIPSRNPTPPPTLALNTSFQGAPAPVPNKHLPFCSPGPTPTFGLPSPPASPPSKESITPAQHVLHPPDPNSKLHHDPNIYAISASTLAYALQQLASQPMPPTSQVFPWLHGLHEDNQMQLAFFAARRAIQRKVPGCLRGLTIIKAGGNLETSKLKGAISPDEVLPPLGASGFAPCFQDANPRVGFSVRNFHVQACKMAAVSDIVIYGDGGTSTREVEDLAKLISVAQTTLREEAQLNDTPAEVFNTFVVTDPFHVFEANHREIVAIDSKGNLTGQVLDFLSQERLEMCSLSKATEIVPNIWLGPTPDPTFYGPAATTADDPQYDIMIEASDIAVIPSTSDLDDVESFLAGMQGDKATAHLEFPSSGSFAAIENGTQTELEVEAILRFFHWLHAITQDAPPPQDPAPSSLPTPSPSPEHEPTTWSDTRKRVKNLRRPGPARRILVHCQDGYTESTLLALAYTMYYHGLTAHDAYINLHTNPTNRNFFAYPTDKWFLENIQLTLLSESPAFSRSIDSTPSTLSKPSPTDYPSPTQQPQPQAPVLVERPPFFHQMDGSLPSRILPHLYLGNLAHAQNPALLQHLGITRVLSVGEPITWHPDDVAAWGPENLMFVDKVQDNGVDPLTGYFAQCLDFIAGKTATADDAAAEDGIQGATLVHCRVGVSRSATIVIAEVMARMGVGFARAYCFVRARRLNVIVQPHLRFVYELMVWEESEDGLRKRWRDGGREIEVENSTGSKRQGREMEWASVCREIAALNRPYCRQ